MQFLSFNRKTTIITEIWIAYAYKHLAQLCLHFGLRLHNAINRGCSCFIEYVHVVRSDVLLVENLFAFFATSLIHSIIHGAGTTAGTAKKIHEIPLIEININCH